jgi:tetratricopeptide (TPR) repeat protein
MEETEQFWDRKRKSPYRFVVALVHAALIWGGLVILIRTRHFQGVGGIYLISAGFIFVTTIHELGHAAVAWALGFKFHAINIGPLTIVKDHFGHRHVRFDWNRLTGHGGYAAAVPVSEEHLRSNAIMMVFAGPFASLNAGLLCFLIYLKLPDSGWEEHWGIPGMLAILFIADFVCNLIPVGYCDGTMLLHLLLWTKHGQDLYAIHLAAKTQDEASERLVQQDFAGEVQLRRKALDQLLARGDSPSPRLGHSYQSLGYALLNHSQRREAAAHLNKSLEVFALCRDIGPIYEANSWKALAHIHRLDQNPEEAQKAIYAALMAFEKGRTASTGRRSEASILAAMAHLHADARNYELGRRTVEEALALIPDGPKHLVHKADLLLVRMRCEAGLLDFTQAKRCAIEAAQILRSPEIPETERSHAASSIGGLAASVWMTGAAENAADLFEESIRALEQRGPSSRAAELRVVLATVLRRSGRLIDAEAALPPESALEPERRKTLLQERAEIFAETGRISQAVADAQEVLKLVEENPEESVVELATAQAKLAEYLLAAGKLAEATDFARHACDVLVPRNHPEGAGPLVTLALIKNDESREPFIEHARKLIQNAPLLEAGSKAYDLERLACRTGLQKSTQHDNLYRQEDLCLPQS